LQLHIKFIRETLANSAQILIFLALPESGKHSYVDKPVPFRLASHLKL